MSITKALRISALCCALWGASASQAELAVVVHPSNPVASMTPSQVAQIFLGSNNVFPSGGGAVAVDQSPGSIREEFAAKVLGKSGAQIRAIWSRLVFSGKALPPRELSTNSAVKNFVASNPKGIGYIERGSVDASVKVVLTIH